MARAITQEEKMLDRIAKILNQGERAPEGSPERELFLDRAYRLAQANSLDLAVVRARTLDKEKVEEPEERKYTVGERGRRTQSSKWGHFADLIIALGESFEMKWLITSDRVTVWLMGYPSDHAMVEKMYGILSTQMVADADAALKAGANKEERLVRITEKVPIPEAERDWGGWDPKSGRWYVDWDDYQNLDEDGEYWSYRANRYVKAYMPPAFEEVPQLDPETGKALYEKKVVSTTDGRIWRTNFYKAFVDRVRQRMHEARQAAMKEAGIEREDASTEKGLALLNKKEEIGTRYEEQMAVRVSKRSKGYGGSDVSQHSHTARAAGRAAAERATYGDEKVVD